MRSSFARIGMAIATASVTFMPLVANAQFGGTNGQLIGISYPGSQYYSSSIVAYNADGSNRHVIYGPDTSPNTLGISAPTMSKDATKIAFINGTPNSGSNVWVMNADGTGAAQITTGVNHFRSPKFSPTGGKIYFINDGASGNSVNSVNIDGTGLTILAAGNNTTGTPGPEYYEVSVSPDGATLLPMALNPLNPGSRTLYKMPADGTAAPTSFMTNAQQADYSPSGTQIAYINGGILTVVSATGGTGVAITDSTLNATNPSWAPDGTGIAFTGYTSGANIPNIYMVKPDGTGLVKQTSNPDATISEASFQWTQLASTNGSTGPFPAGTPTATPRTVTTIPVTDSQPTLAVTIAANNTLVVDGARGNITVQSGGILGGHGTVGTVTVQAGGALAPGNSPGCLASSNLALAAGSSFNVDIAGPTACTGYDQQVVTGTVDLGGATLNLNLTYVPTAGAKFMIISNDAVDPIVGTFAGLAEGATVTANGYNFTISYIGGDGNDVELTAVGAAVVPGLPAASHSTGSAPLALIFFAILFVAGIEVGRRARANR